MTRQGVVSKVLNKKGRLWPSPDVLCMSSKERKAISRADEM